MLFSLKENETRRKDRYSESYQEQRGTLHNDKGDNSPKRQNKNICILIKQNIKIPEAKTDINCKEEPTKIPLKLETSTLFYQ